MPIPDSIMNGTLTSVTVNGRYVAPYSFYNQSNLSKVKVNMNIAFVDTGGFKNCTSITSSTFTFSTILWIGSEAFRGCTGLSGALNLSGAHYIGSNAFRDTNISEITLGMRACVLASVNAFPKSLTTIKVPSDLVDEYKSYPVWSTIADKIVSR